MMLTLNWQQLTTLNKNEVNGMDHMKFETPDLTAQNIDKLAALFPGCVTEGPDGKGGLKKAVNFELLRQML